MDIWKEFTSPSTQEWEEKILKDLKIKSLKELDWNSSIGEINPVQNKTNEINSTYSSNQITINSEFNLNNKAINSKILYALKCGINSITLKGIPNSNSLDGVMLEIIDSHILLSNENLTNDYATWSNWLKKLGKEINISFKFDPIFKLISEGKWNQSKLEDLKNWNLFYNSNDHKLIKSIYVDGSIYGNASANPIQEIAFIGAHLNEYFEEIEDLDKNHKVIIKISTGTSYLIEIAKLRALRIIINSIAKHRKISIDLTIETVGKNTCISPINKELNLLRATTYTMSSIIGGADRISISPEFVDEKDYKKTFRLFTNIPIVLKEESNVSKVNDPSRGSYAIEDLTSKIKNESWKLFKSIEKSGGWIQYLKTKNAQNECRKNAVDLINRLVNKNAVIIGFNKYNLNDSPINTIEFSESSAFSTLKLDKLI